MAVCHMVFPIDDTLLVAGGLPGASHLGKESPCALPDFQWLDYSRRDSVSES